jgi:hypothetical protein
LGDGDENAGGGEGLAGGGFGLFAMREAAVFGLFLDERGVDFEHARNVVVGGELHGGMGEQGMPFVDEIVRSGLLQL